MQNDKQELNDVAPSSIRHMIGQQSVIDQVTVALDAAMMDGLKFDDSLLVGPPGLGKSALANIIAAEMCVDMHSVLAQNMKCPSDLHLLLLSAKPKSIVFIDEVHELAQSVQTALYLMLDKKQIVVAAGKGKRPACIPLTNFTVLLATTDEYNLLQPLRDRMRLTLRFDYYSEEDLEKVVQSRSQALGWETDEHVPGMIATRSRGTPRLALRLLQSCRRVCRSQGETMITTNHLIRACELEQLDHLGLGPTEQKYLKIVADGNTRLNVIASMLGLPSRTVAEATEPFLIRSELIVKDDQGRRQLTANAHMYLSDDDVSIEEIQ